MLPGIAEHASQRERIAIEAERETTDMKKIEYMMQFVGEEFEGVISGVTAFGIFVELDNGVEGLVHVSTMVNDYYSYVEEQFAMVGERTRQQYRLGDKVEVILARANVEERTLDFVLKDNGIYAPKPAQKGKAPGDDGENAGKRHGKKKPSRRGKTKRETQDLLVAVSDAKEQPAKKRKKASAHRHRPKRGRAKKGAK